MSNQLSLSRKQGTNSTGRKSLCHKLALLYHLDKTLKLCERVGKQFPCLIKLYDRHNRCIVFLLCYQKKSLKTAKESSNSKCPSSKNYMVTKVSLSIHLCWDMAETAQDDKPFKCSSCDQRFANSDHLLVHKKTHQQGLQVKMPLLASTITDSIADETPTPTRFLKTADVEGSQLFEEINPFDQYFATKRVGDVTSSSTTVTSSSSNILQTPTIMLPEVHSNNVITSTNSQVSVKPEPTASPKKGVVSLPKVASVTGAPNKVVIIKKPNKTATQTLTVSPKRSIKRPIEAVAQPQSDETSGEKKIKTDLSGPIKSNLVPTEDDVKTKPAGVSSHISAKPSGTSSQLSAQDIIKEQLTALINSGQLKIQFSADPSTSSLQAVILGNTPTKTTATVTPPSTATVTPPSSASDTFSLLSKFPPQPVKSVIHNSASILTCLGQNTTPTMSVITSGNAVVYPNNLNLVKQRLKETIQNTNSENNNILSPRATMVQSSSSNQGKYKDIILSEDFTQNLMTEQSAASRRKRSTDETTPDEKRQRFLERNRAAASRCRQKRKIWVNQLEKKSEDLQNTNSQLMNEITALRAEVAQLKALLIAHKDCPVTLQHKALLGQIGSSGASYVAVSGGQLIAIHEVPTSGATGHPTSAEEVATSALTDMAGRATMELANHVSTGTVTVHTSDGPLPAISTTII